jgi:Flp pilus assembly protein TadD
MTTLLCALVAVQLSGRRDDERTLRAANEAGAAGRYEQAGKLAARLTDGTTAPDAWMVRATVAIREGRLDSAERALRRAIELRPNDWRVHRDLAAVLALLGDQRAAFREFSRAGELNPKMPPLGNFGAP